MKKKTQSWKWWTFALVAFLFFILLQIPATWILAKFSNNNQMLQNVSGNIWRGQADWSYQNLRGSVQWKTRFLDLLMLRYGADIQFHSGQTQLEGIVAYGLNKRLSIKNLSGEVAPETLKSVVNWQWPNSPIQLKKIDLHYKSQQGFSKVDGNLYWGGGDLTYVYGQRQDRMNVPALKGQLQDQDGKLKIEMNDQKNQKMANLILGADGMLDVQLTQRLLLNIPSYDGKAGLDTYVISSRQPLMKGSF